MSFCVTRGKVDDRQVVDKLTQGLTGLLVADKGYIDKKLTERLADKGLSLSPKCEKI